MEILDSAQDLEFLSLAVLLAANIFKGIIYPTSWSIQNGSYILHSLCKLAEGPLLGNSAPGAWTKYLSDFEDFLTALTSIISIIKKQQ